MAIGWFQWTQYGLNPNKHTLFHDFHNKSFILKVNTAHRNFVLTSAFTKDYVNLTPLKSGK